MSSSKSREQLRFQEWHEVLKQHPEMLAIKEVLEALPAREAIIAGVSVIDMALTTWLRQTWMRKGSAANFLLKGPLAPIGSLSTRSNLAYCLDIITKEELSLIDEIRAIRNFCSHNLHVDFLSEAFYNHVLKALEHTETSAKIVAKNMDSEPKIAVMKYEDGKTINFNPLHIVFELLGELSNARAGVVRGTRDIVMTIPGEGEWLDEYQANLKDGILLAIVAMHYILMDRYLKTFGPRAFEAYEEHFRTEKSKPKPKKMRASNKREGDDNGPS